MTDLERTMQHLWYVNIRERYSSVWNNRRFKTQLPIAFMLFAIAITANTLAGIYATESASNSVTDIILSNVPVFDVDQLFVYSTIVFIAIVFALLALNPRTAPFALCSLALLYLIRAIFVSLTHIGPFPEHVTLDFQSKIILLLWGGGDEFFSGHTGTPFLLALIFWQERRLRYFFLAATAFFAAIVLLGHLHYSIDVLSAIFITYTIYRLSLQLFPGERTLFDGDPPASAPPPAAAP